MTPKFLRIRTSICDFGEVLGSRRSQRWRSTKKTDAIREKAKFCGRPGPDKILDQPPGFFSNFDKILWVGPQNWRTSGDPLISPHPHQHLRFWRGVGLVAEPAPAERKQDRYYTGKGELGVAQDSAKFWTDRQDFCQTLKKSCGLVHKIDGYPVTPKFRRIRTSICDFGEFGIAAEPALAERKKDRYYAGKVEIWGSPRTRRNSGPTTRIFVKL